MNLQKELFEARSYHVNLHVEYMQLKSAYERLVNVTEDEWQAVEKFGVVEPVKRVISKFWEDIEFITTAFFDILELLNRKDYLERSILTIWKSQLAQARDKAPPQEEVPSEDGIAVVPGYLEYMNSQLIELRGRIKWVEYNLMKYRFAASHGQELKSVIDQVLKGSKRSKWPRLPRPWRHQHRKLEQEVEWYRKRLKFFRDDVQRIKSVHQAIFQKYLTPEDQKRFPSTAFTLEYRLKGNPTNYPGSWFETSMHSGLSMNLSGHSSTSGNTWTISMAGPSRLESPSAINANTIESGGQEQDKVEPEGMSLKLNDRDARKIKDSNFEALNTDGKFVIEANFGLNQEIPNNKLNRKKVRDHERNPEQESRNSPIRLPSSISQCYGDGRQKSSIKIPITNSNVMENGAQLRLETSKIDVVNKVLDDRNPFLKDEASKTERSASATNSNASTNPFGDDDVDERNDGAGNAEEDCHNKGGPEKIGEMINPEQCSKKSSTLHPSSDSSYESAEEVLATGTVERASTIPDQQPAREKSPARLSQYSSLTHLASSVYVPCSLPIYENNGPAMRHVDTLSAPRVPQMVNNYELLFATENDRPPRNVLRKLFGRKR